MPKITIDLLRGACANRGVEFIDVHAPAFLFDPESQLLPGDMLYRPSVSLAAMRVEQFLFTEGVASFYADSLRVFFVPNNTPLLFQRAGLPVPRMYPLAVADPELIRVHVKALGGFPLIVKLPGEGGVGTMQVDNFSALFSLIDLLCAQKQDPILCAFIDRAVHWRMIVIGDRVIASYRNVPRTDDFRTYASEDKLDFVPPAAGMAELAVRAVKILRLEFGGVDVLEHPSGRRFLLEANFPCYFAHPQVVAGIDVAGMMLDHLVAKAQAVSGS